MSLVARGSVHAQLIFGVGPVPPLQFPTRYPFLVQLCADERVSTRKEAPYSSKQLLMHGIGLILLVRSVAHWLLVITHAQFSIRFFVFQLEIS